MRVVITLLLFFYSLLALGQTTEEYVEMADEAYDSKDVKTALRFVSKALETDSLNIELLNDKGFYLENLELYQEAYDTYGKSISIDPGFRAHNSRAIILQQVGEFEYSIGEFTEALKFAEADSTRCTILSNRASAKAWKRDFDGAYKDLIGAYEIDSTSLAVLINLGAICDEVGRGDETMKYLLQAAAIYPDDIAVNGNIGFKYQNDGNHEEALKYFNRLIEIDPNEPLAYSNSSYSLWKTGDMKGAMKAINKSIELYPANSYAYRNRALFYLDQGKKDKACIDFQTALDKGYAITYGDEVTVLQRENCD